MSRKTPSAFEQAVAQIPTCALDQEGMRAQRERYARLGDHVRRIEREPKAVIVEFREGFHSQTLEQALAVEQSCCPFFVFDFDKVTRRLRAGVREDEQLPALDAMVHALGAAQQARTLD